MKTVLRLLPLCLLFLACSEEEDYTYPNLLSEFAEVCTDAQGASTRLITDDGEQLTISNAEAIPTEGITPDSVYRVITRYVRTGNQAEIYSLQAIPSSYAQPASAFPDGIKSDPVEMQSIWTGGNYLNMILLVKAQNGKHTFRFVEDSLITSPTGRHTLCLSLYHDAGDDVQAYTQKAYLSVPLLPYSDSLNEGDTLLMRIPTASGWQEWRRIGCTSEEKK